MPEAISLPMWVLLIVVIGLPVHISVNKGLAHWRRHYEISAIATMSLVMMACHVILPLLQGGMLDLHDLIRHLEFAGAAGVLFGGPIGVIVRLVIGSERTTTLAA
jgi:hypothetical protein